MIETFSFILTEVINKDAIPFFVLLIRGGEKKKKKLLKENSNLGNVSLSQDGWSLREISSLSKGKELYLSV